MHLYNFVEKYEDLSTRYHFCAQTLKFRIRKMCFNHNKIIIVINKYYSHMHTYIIQSCIYAQARTCSLILTPPIVLSTYSYMYVYNICWYKFCIFGPICSISSHTNTVVTLRYFLQLYPAYHQECTTLLLSYYIDKLCKELVYYMYVKLTLLSFCVCFSL